MYGRGERKILPVTFAYIILYSILALSSIVRKGCYLSLLLRMSISYPLYKKLLACIKQAKKIGMFFYGSQYVHVSE